jgi:hypothetical protein
VPVVVDGWGLGFSRRILIDATRMSLCENTDMIRNIYADGWSLASMKHRLGL